MPIDETDKTEALRGNRRPIGHRKGSRTGQRASSSSASPFGSVQGLLQCQKRSTAHLKECHMKSHKQVATRVQYKAFGAFGQERGPTVA